MATGAPGTMATGHVIKPASLQGVKYNLELGQDLFIVSWLYNSRQSDPDVPVSVGLPGDAGYPVYRVQLQEPNIGGTLSS